MWKSTWEGVGDNIVGKEDFGMIECFKVMTMLEVVEKMRCEGVATRVTDHSSMHWEVAIDLEGEVKGEAGEAVVEKRYRVPEGYLDDEVGRVRMLIGQIEGAGDDRTAIDEAYDKLLVMMKGGLVVVKAKRKRGQPWFTREIAKLRKLANGAERERLRCSDKVAKRGKRREYVEKRRVYKRAVGKAN